MYFPRLHKWESTQFSCRTALEILQQTYRPHPSWQPRYLHPLSSPPPQTVRVYPQWHTDWADQTPADPTHVLETRNSVVHFIMALHVAPCPSIKILSLLVVCKYSGRQVDGRIGKVSNESRMTMIKVGCVIQDLKYSAPPLPPRMVLMEKKHSLI